MGIFLWVVFGVAMGAISRTVMPGPRAGGTPVGILVGAVGGVLAGTTVSFLTDGPAVGVDVQALLAAFSGTLFSLLAYRAYALRTEEWPEGRPAALSAPVLKGSSRARPVSDAIISPAVIPGRS
jgi:uncharacterized membrane protein YeaQ/YmgE (transglycosylase-associated protein family)